MNSISREFYSKTLRSTWKGRNDGDDAAVQRWHQRITCVDLLSTALPQVQRGKRDIALIGFACDEGVLRNGGRVGAKDGPLCIRQACGNLPVHFSGDVSLTDLGDITCETEAMEEAQNELAKLVALALNKGYQPLVLGGGHEMAYAHYKGIRKFLPPADSIGIINFDAHFDLREPGDRLTNSGTGFFQIAEECQLSERPFRYLTLGIQQNSNTKRLYDTAEGLGVEVIHASDFSITREKQILAQLREFIQRSTAIYLSIDLDVFSFAVAPGVSAPAYAGLFPDPLFFSCLQSIISNPRFISMDIAEYNPLYDPDHRTAKLAAALAFELVSR